MQIYMLHFSQLLQEETSHTQPMAQYLRAAAISRTTTRLSSSGSASRAGHASPDCRGAPRIDGAVEAQRTTTLLELLLAKRRNAAHARAWWKLFVTTCSSRVRGASRFSWRSTASAFSLVDVDVISRMGGRRNEASWRAWHR